MCARTDVARGLYRASCVTPRPRALAEGGAEACESPGARRNAAGERGEVAKISEVVTLELSPHRATLARPLTLFCTLISNRIQLEIPTLHLFSPFLSKIFYHEKFRTYRRSKNSVMNGQASTTVNSRTLCHPCPSSSTRLKSKCQTSQNSFCKYVHVYLEKIKTLCA